MGTFTVKIGTAKCNRVLCCFQDIVLPFQASAEVHWRHPLAQAADPAARQLLANCQLGSIRVQPAFGHVALLQAIQHHVQTGIAMLRQVSRNVIRYSAHWLHLRP